MHKALYKVDILNDKDFIKFLELYTKMCELTPNSEPRFIIESLHYIYCCDTVLVIGLYRQDILVGFLMGNNNDDGADKTEGDNLIKDTFYLAGVYIEEKYRHFTYGLSLLIEYASYIVKKAGYSSWEARSSTLLSKKLLSRYTKVEDTVTRYRMRLL